MKNNIKKHDAYKTIGETAKVLGLMNKKTGRLQTHTIRYWETQFKQINPSIRAGGRRYFDVQPYRAESSGVIPMVVLNIGKKYIHITGGKYLNSFLKAVFDFK